MHRQLAAASTHSGQGAPSWGRFHMALLWVSKASWFLTPTCIHCFYRSFRSPKILIIGSNFALKTISTAEYTFQDHLSLEATVQSKPLCLDYHRTWGLSAYTTAARGTAAPKPYMLFRNITLVSLQQLLLHSL